MDFATMVLIYSIFDRTLAIPLYPFSSCIFICSVPVLFLLYTATKYQHIIWEYL